METAKPFLDAFNHATRLQEDAYKKGHDDGYKVGYQAALIEHKVVKDGVVQTESGLVVPAHATPQGKAS